MFELRIESDSPQGTLVKLDNDDLWVCAGNWTYSGLVRDSFDSKRLLIDIFRYRLGWPELVVFHHINGDRLDFRKANLGRIEVTEGQFSRVLSGRSSKYRGVSYNANRVKPWLAQFSHKGKRVLQRYYETELEAALAYNRAAIGALGEGASLNSLHIA